MGIPLSEMMRVMSAVLLLGNIQFVQGSGLELDLATNSGTVEQIRRVSEDNLGIILLISP